MAEELPAHNGDITGKLAQAGELDLNIKNDDGGTAQSPNIPVQREEMPESCEEGSTNCHCGRTSCAWLRHSNELVEDLERDVKTAGQLGQALLIRHETYVTEAETERKEMKVRIEHLETDKLKLERENQQILDENRGLLDHCGQLNDAVGEAETRIESLEATLQATHGEMRRLETLANRTMGLELQLMELERERDELRHTITHTEAEEKAAIRRWKQSERKLAEVQEQLEKIENDAHDDQLRHEEVLRRMERQKQVDKELQSGKAVVEKKGGTNVVSHFVKDILQDNVNLQMGIVELRDMLMSSNDEVQKLRNQLIGREPLDTEDQQEEGTQTTLEAELTAKEPPTPTQSLHVHHHYHVPKAQEVRRSIPKKKRNVALPQSGMHSRGSSRHRSRPSQPSIAATILSQTSMTIPSPTRPQANHRWSMQSYGAPSEFASSAPSSPQDYRSSVLFDRMSIDQSMDYSRPTSPELSDYATSPNFRPTHKRKVSEQSSNGSRNISPRGQQLYPTETIHEEEDHDVPDLPTLEVEPPRSPVTQDDSGLGLDYSNPDTFDPFAPTDDFKPRLRRSNSHESILSVAGLDIHTLKSRPSQMTINKSGLIPNSFRNRGQIGASSAVLSTVDAFGTGELSAATLSQGRIDSRSLLRSTAGLPERPLTAKSTTDSEGTVVGSAPKKQGGWIWGRWGMKPTSSSPSPSRSSTPAQSRAASLVDVHPPPLKIGTRAVTMPIRKLQEEERENDPLKLMLGRSPGINQAGPIPGWRKPARAPSQITPLRVDFEALREVLEEEG